jgi:hypothetical protein
MLDRSRVKLYIAYSKYSISCIGAVNGYASRSKIQTRGNEIHKERKIALRLYFLY